MGRTAPPAAVGAAPLGEVFRREYPALLRLATVMTQDHEQAQDVVQEAFVQVQRRYGGLREPELLPGYLRVCVVNGARSGHRRLARWRRRGLPVDPVVAPADSAVMRQAEYRSVVAAVQDLPRRQQQVVALRFWGERSDAEIAVLLGISEGSVRSTVSRGLDAVRRRLMEELAEEGRA